MNKIHYFTDIDLLSSQISEDAYGPVVSGDSDYLAGEDRFRVSSHHSATANLRAYAICDGQVLVQQDANNVNLVNILLRPSEQPNNDLPKIKYFIYRGVLKNSLSDGANVVDGGSTLTKKIIAHNPITPQKVLGLELTGINYSDTDPVDNAFYIPNLDFELWKVFGGWSIGVFNATGFGFEIIYESSGYEITFEALRATKHLVRITSSGGSLTQAEIFELRTKKQEILNYLDPAAFWGSLYNYSVFARNSTDATNSDFVHVFEKKKKDEIYRDLIEGGTVGSPTNIYQNKNCVYLDIRNNHNDSFNYFGLNNDELRISFVDDNNEPAVSFNYYTSQWPILNLASIPGGGNESPIRIAFPTTSIASPLIQVLCGNRRYSIKERIKEGKSVFKRFEDYMQSGYTQGSLFLETSNYDTGPAVSNYIKLKIIDSHLDDNIVANNNIPFRKFNSFDFIFQPTKLKQFFTTNDKIKLHIYDDESYINLLSDYGIDYSAKIGIGKDQGNTILFWVLSKRNTKNRFKASIPSYSITSSTENVSDYFVKYINTKALPDRITESPSSVMINGDDVQLLQEIEGSFSYFSKKNDINYNSEFSALILSDSDFNSILTIANANFTSIYAPYLCVSNMEVILDDNNKPVTQVELSLKGLAENGVGEIEILEVLTGITVYTSVIKKN